jgi:hypothetical protein
MGQYISIFEVVAISVIAIFCYVFIKAIIKLFKSN